MTWEKEKGNFEANWGGETGEDMSVLFKPSGAFIEQVEAIAPAALPAAVTAYIDNHYKGAKVKEAGKVTDASGQITYETELQGKELIFDQHGSFIKAETGND